MTIVLRVTSDIRLFALKRPLPKERSDAARRLSRFHQVLLVFFLDWRINVNNFTFCDRAATDTTPLDFYHSDCRGHKSFWGGVLIPSKAEHRKGAEEGAKQSTGKGKFGFLSDFAVKDAVTYACDWCKCSDSNVHV